MIAFKYLAELPIHLQQALQGVVLPELLDLEDNEIIQVFYRYGERYSVCAAVNEDMCCYLLRKG